MGMVMAGIDYTKASIDERERFSLTLHGVEKGVKRMMTEENISGCIILSTCNRTEIWISTEDEELCPVEMLKVAAGVKNCHKVDCCIRKGRDALNHLFRLSCGMESMITGEDQILTQIKKAMAISQEARGTNVEIEKVFQHAITAAKRVKTKVKLNSANPSIATGAVEYLREKLGSLENVPCMVVGNGQMGRLLSSALCKSGARVTMTLRRKTHKDVIQDRHVHDGCHMIAYEDRFSRLNEFKCVISATLSPHRTINYGNISHMNFEDSIFIDLAVPRDIDKKVGEIGGIQLINIDDLYRLQPAERADDVNGEAIAAEEILGEQLEELEKWLAFRKHVEKIKKISELTRADAVARMEDSGIEDSMERAISKLLFGLRDSLDETSWEECFEAMERSAKRDTLKTGRPSVEK